LCVLERLPGWVVDNATSIGVEVEPYRRMSMLERWRATRRCCESASAILRFNRRPERVLEYRDPLPESTQRALRRLRSIEHAA
jgi:hypothetical protein